MAMNIKSEETHRLAKEVVQLTGESMTAAITTALRERLERLRDTHSKSLADKLLAIADDAAPRFKEPFLSTDHGDLLYDEDGLPR